MKIIDLLARQVFGKNSLDEINDPFNKVLLSFWLHLQVSGTNENKSKDNDTGDRRHQSDSAVKPNRTNVKH